MLPYERDFFIARIKCGYLRLRYEDKIFKYKLTNDAIYESEEVFLDTYNKCLESDILTEEMIYPFLIERGLWSETEEERLNVKIPDYMENIKIEMYRSIEKPEDLKRMKLYIDKVKKEMYKIFQIRHQFDYLSCSGAAIYARWHFLIQECVKNIDDTKIDWSKVNPHEILNLINELIIDETDIRYLARNDPWVGIWTISKKNGNIFDNLISNYTEEQKRLVSWSMYYDNVREYEEPPTEEVIEDDDCFDGYMILKRRQQEKEKGIDSVNRRANKHKDSQELFIPIKNQYSSEYLAPDGSIIKTGEDAEKILSMNNPLTNSIIQSRFNAIKEHGPLKAIELPDVKFQLGLQMTKLEHSIQSGK